jgi:hypothetical protein
LTHEELNVTIEIPHKINADGSLSIFFPNIGNKDFVTYKFSLSKFAPKHQGQNKCFQPPMGTEGQILEEMFKLLR